MFVHANLDTMKAQVREDVLYNMDHDTGSWVPCEIVSVSSYKGSVPTFQIVVEKESIFSYIPPHLIRFSETDSQMLELSDLVYHNCPDYEFALTKLDYLSSKEFSVFIRGQKRWMRASYLFSMDWHRGNDLLHCVLLSNRQPGFFPSHKLALGKEHFKPYLKLKREWKV